MKMFVILCFTLLTGSVALVGCKNSVEAGDAEQPVLHREFGDATYYAHFFQGDRTASGLRFDQRKPLAAHRSYPFGTVLRVTNRANGKATIVVVVDRGPYGKNRREGAIVDLSRKAAERLGMIRDGQVRVRVDVLQWGEGNSTPSYR
jgi:rare lipoprotein A